MFIFDMFSHFKLTCCFCRYLIEHGAHVGAVNSEGELPLDVATEDAMERLLKAEIKKQGTALLCVLVAAKVIFIIVSDATTIKMLIVPGTNHVIITSILQCKCSTGSYYTNRMLFF